MKKSEKSSKLTIGLAQTHPVWLNKEATLQKVLSWIAKASASNCDLLNFGETFLPGYPFWIELTDGARFESSIQKDLYAYYLEQAVIIENGDLSAICEACKENQIALVIGCAERPLDRGGYSVYCSAVHINKNGEITSVHRKLMPTYEERLCWAIGDGNGLTTNKVGAFTSGVLNCWENWMPLLRSALYAQGEDLHLALWPGNLRNTEDITRFIARESRSYVCSTSSLLFKEQIPSDIPHYAFILEKCPDVLGNGGSCIALPNGEWLVEPLGLEEKLIVAELDRSLVARERQNFDPSGHYSRPDITQLTVNISRQSVLKFDERKPG